MNREVVTGPELNIVDLQPVPELREARFSDPKANIVIAEFEFSSGKAGQVVVSRRIAPTEGMQFMIVAANREEGMFTPQDVSDAIFVAHRLMAEHPHLAALAEDPQIGFQISMNRGGMKNKFEAPDHVQIIVPGSAEDRLKAPRLTDAWE